MDLGAETLCLLLCASLLWAGCGDGPATPESVDPASLSPDDLVFAAGRGGGFAQEGAQMFYWSHHPDLSLYVFGDHRLVYLDQTTIPTLGYRVWREGQVPEETFTELLDLAVAVDPDDGGSYQRCPMLDGPMETVYVGLPGVTVTASCFSLFGGCPEHEVDPEEWETPPPDALVDLFEALTPLRKLPAEILQTDQILLGVQSMDDPIWGCDLSSAVPWPFDKPAFPGELQEGGYGTNTIDPPLAGQVRDFLRLNMEKRQGSDYPTTCVSRDGEAYLVFYDDMLPNEEGYPF